MDELEYTHMLCLKTVMDDDGVYCIKGNLYEILEEDEDTYTIESEQGQALSEHPESAMEITIKKDDPDFQPMIKFEEEE